MRAVSAEQMRRLDHLARKQFAIPELILMEHAGTALARRVLLLLGQGRFRRCSGGVWVLSGGGANGGDGLVAARHLDNGGIPVRVIRIGSMRDKQGAADQNLRIVRRLKIPMVQIRSLQEWNRWAARRRSPRLIVDALLGTGIHGAVREPMRSVILWVNRQPCPVVAADLPSGLSSESGAPCGVAVEAEWTVSFGLPKFGLICRCARPWVGRWEVADISLPRTLRGPIS